MPNDNVIKLSLPGTFEDQLTEVLRSGAQTLLAKAVERWGGGVLVISSGLCIAECVALLFVRTTKAPAIS